MTVKKITTKKTTAKKTSTGKKLTMNVAKSKGFSDPGTFQYADYTKTPSYYSTPYQQADGFQWGDFTDTGTPAWVNNVQRPDAPKLNDGSQEAQTLSQTEMEQALRAIQSQQAQSDANYEGQYSDLNFQTQQALADAAKRNNLIAARLNNAVYGAGMGRGMSADANRAAVQSAASNEASGLNSELIRNLQKMYQEQNAADYGFQNRTIDAQSGQQAAYMKYLRDIYDSNQTGYANDISVYNTDVAQQTAMNQSNREAAQNYMNQLNSYNQAMYTSQNDYGIKDAQMANDWNQNLMNGKNTYNMNTTNSRNDYNANKYDRRNNYNVDRTGMANDWSLKQQQLAKASSSGGSGGSSGYGSGGSSGSKKKDIKNGVVTKKVAPYKPSNFATTGQGQGNASLQYIIDNQFRGGNPFTKKTTTPTRYVNAGYR